MPSQARSFNSFQYLSLHSVLVCLTLSSQAPVTDYLLWSAEKPCGRHADLSNNHQRHTNLTQCPQADHPTALPPRCCNYKDRQTNHKSTGRQVLTWGLYSYSVWSHWVSRPLHCESSGATGMFSGSSIPRGDGQKASESHRRS